MIWPFMKPEPRLAVELFAGAAGGWALGLHWAGVETVCAVEKVWDRAAAYRRRWPMTAMFDDVRGHVLGARMRSLSTYPRRPWLVCGSPPCKGISEVNHKGRGVDDDGLFFDAIRVALELRPVWIALENVARLKSRGADRVIAALEAGGYTCWPVVVGSEAAGKDHERPRVIIVAAAPDAARRKGRFARQPWAAPFSPAARRNDIGLPEDRREGLGHLRPETLGRHVRAYDGVSDRVADFARGAFGDALDPLIAMAIVQALIEWEEGPRLIVRKGASGGLTQAPAVDFWRLALGWEE